MGDILVDLLRIAEDLKRRLLIEGPSIRKLEQIFNNFFKWLRNQRGIWIIKSESISNLETGIKMSLICLPGKFHEQELIYEIFSSLASLIRTLFDGIFLSSVIEYGKLHPTLNTSEDNSELDAKWMKNLTQHQKKDLTKIYQRIPLTILQNTTIHAFLTVINHTELLLEVVSDNIQTKLSASKLVNNIFFNFPIHRIELVKTIILFIESIKVYLRLLLLVKNRSMLIMQELPSQSTMLTMIKEEKTKNINTDENCYNTKKLTLRNLLKTSKNLFPAPLTLKTALGEIMYIIRPLIYLYFKFFGRSPWKSIIISFFIDFISINLSSNNSLSRSGRTEISRRKWTLAYYMLRTPVFEFACKYFKGIDRISNIVSKKIPFAKIILDWLDEILFMARRRYFITAGTDSP